MTDRQLKQLAWLNKCERFESARKTAIYDAKCRTCDITKVLYSAKGCRAFIQNHEGHGTWLKRVAQGVDPLNPIGGEKRARTSDQTGD